VVRQYVEWMERSDPIIDRSYEVDGFSLYPCHAEDGEADELSEDSKRSPDERSKIRLVMPSTAYRFARAGHLLAHQVLHNIMPELPKPFQRIRFRSRLNSTLCASRQTLLADKSRCRCRLFAARKWQFA
jgi:hypothetical protein